MSENSNGNANSVDQHIYYVSTERCGTLTVVAQGDLSMMAKKAVFLTVHDMGSNSNSMTHFIDHPAMHEIKQRSIFLNVNITGQEDNAQDLPDDFVFPSMQTLGEDLVNVLDQLKVNIVVGLGDGAGANILTRFGMANPNRCLGLILIHPTCATASVKEYFKEKFISWKLQNIGANPTAEQYLVFHKFGGQLEQAENKEKLILEYTEKLKSNINPKNLKKYVESFMNRKDISGQLDKSLQLETLLVVGSRASHVHSVHSMYACMNKAKTSLLKIDGVGDVLMEAPEKFSQSLLLFCKGIGVLTSAAMPGLERQKSVSSGDEGEPGERRRSKSMEEYDQPRRKSVPSK